jgi:hypothetical protein
MDIPPSVYPFTSDKHLDSYHFMALMSMLLVNIHVRVFVWTYVFISLGQISSRIAGSYGKFMLSILRNCQFSKVAAIFYIPTSNG